MVRILLIGGCGYIGSALFQFFEKKNYQVDTVDLEWFGNFSNPRNLKRDYRSLSKSFLSTYDVVILLAGLASVQLCEGRLYESFKNNVENFIYLLKKLEGQKFIYASSSSVYGNTGAKLVDEEYDRYTPTNFYDLTKKEIDYYAQLSGTNFYGLRFGTVNGVSPNLRVDLMINKMYESAITLGKIIVVNPHLHRPILGVNDLCRAILTIIGRGNAPGIYNLASFNGTVGEIAKCVSQELGGIKIEEKTAPQMYDFSISCDKFKRRFSFQFQDTVFSITRDLARGFATAHKSERKSLTIK